MLTPEEISYALMHLKFNLSLTTGEMAKEMDVSRQTVFNLLNCKSCSMNTYKKVVKYIGDHYGN